MYVVHKKVELVRFLLCTVSQKMRQKIKRTENPMFTESLKVN